MAAKYNYDVEWRCRRGKKKVKKGWILERIFESSTLARETWGALAGFGEQAHGKRKRLELCG